MREGKTHRLLRASRNRKAAEQSIRRHSFVVGYKLNTPQRRHFNRAHLEHSQVGQFAHHELLSRRAAVDVQLAQRRLLVETVRHC